MNKKIILIGLVVFGIGIVWWVWFRMNEQKSSLSTVSSERVRFEYNDVLKEEDPFQKIYTYGQNTISFKPSNGSALSQNPGYGVYLDGKTIGTLSGRALDMPLFSSNGGYFVFDDRNTCGAGCNFFSLYIVNINSGELINIQPPQKSEDYSGDVSQYRDKAQPFINSYSFNGDTLDVNFFFIGVDKEDGNTYRISQEELWSYDLDTKKYTFIKYLSV